jgi:hypothetical protein
MNSDQRHILTGVLTKYRFFGPINSHDQKKIRRAKKRGLSAILKSADIKSHGLNYSIFIYYYIRKFGLSIKIATGARVLRLAEGTLALFLAATTAFILNNYIFQSLPAGKGTLTYIHGDVKIINGERTRHAKIRDTIIKGDRIITSGDSSVCMQIPASTVVRLLPDSTLDMRSILDKGTTTLHLNNGTVLSKLARLDKDKSYSITTPNALLTVRGTIFSVSYKPGTTELLVWEGAVRVQRLISKSSSTGSEDEIIINPGYKAIVTDIVSVQPMSEDESLGIKMISPIPYINHIDTMDDAAILNMLAKALEKKDTARALTFNEIEKKYGHVYRIYLYTGKTILGAVISRDDQWTIVTEQGIVKISRQDIKTAQ